MSLPTPITIDGLPTLTINALNAYSGSFDGTNDLFVVYQKSSTSTVNVSRNVALGLSSAPVGLSDSQTLTNKTLTAPTISAPVLSGTITGTYTIGGTPTFPTSVVTLTGTQTLTNKTLTSPTLTAPTITNATISANAVTGFTTANTGTIYGVSVAGGLISGTSLVSASVTSTQIAVNGVSAANLATNAITLGRLIYTAGSVTVPSGSSVQLTGLTLAVTIPGGGRGIELTLCVPTFTNSASTGVATFVIWRGAVGSGTQVTTYNMGGSALNEGFTMIGYDTPSAGAVTYNIAGSVAVSGTATLFNGSGFPITLVAKAI